jgi:hypothetical protein
MRKLVPLALAALLTIGFVMPAAAAGRPEMFDNEPITQLFEDICAFDVGLEDSFAAGKVLIFPTDDAGTTLLMSAGGFKSTLTNLEDTDNTIDITFFGRLGLLFLPDGNIELTVSGQALAWFQTPEDAAMYGLEPGIYLITGHVEVLLNANQEALAPASGNFRARDLCAELAD